MHAEALTPTSTGLPTWKEDCGHRPSLGRGHKAGGRALVQPECPRAKGTGGAPGLSQKQRTFFTHRYDNLCSFPHERNAFSPSSDTSEEKIKEQLGHRQTRRAGAWGHREAPGSPCEPQTRGTAGAVQPPVLGFAARAHTHSTRSATGGATLPRNGTLNERIFVNRFQSPVQHQHSRPAALSGTIFTHKTAYGSLSPYPFNRHFRRQSVTMTNV